LTICQHNESLGMVLVFLYIDMDHMRTKKQHRGHTTGQNEYFTVVPVSIFLHTVMGMSPGAVLLHKASYLKYNLQSSAG
jgi:hypothetical protein